jgi:hypothetical protein
MNRVQLINIFKEKYVGKNKFIKIDWYRVTAVKEIALKCTVGILETPTGWNLTGNGL